jgi:hypothetical protein
MAHSMDLARRCRGPTSPRRMLFCSDDSATHLSIRGCKVIRSHFRILLVETATQRHPCAESAMIIECYRPLGPPR